MSEFESFDPLWSELVFVQEEYFRAFEIFRDADLLIRQETIRDFLKDLLVSGVQRLDPT